MRRLTDSLAWPLRADRCCSAGAGPGPTEREPHPGRLRREVRIPARSPASTPRSSTFTTAPTPSRMPTATRSASLRILRAASGSRPSLRCVWYVSKAKILGANYGAFVVLPFANASLEAPAFALGETVDTSFSDMLVRPLDLGWHTPQRRLRRRASSSTCPRAATSRAATTTSARACGRTSRSSGRPSIFDEKKTFSLATTAYWEFHGKKEDTDVKVGQILTLARRPGQVVPRRRADHRRGVLRPVEDHQGPAARVRTARRRRDRAGLPEQAQGVRLRAGRDAADRDQVEALRPGQHPLSLGDGRAREDAGRDPGRHGDLPDSQREAEVSGSELAVEERS